MKGTSELYGRDFGFAGMTHCITRIIIAKPVIGVLRVSGFSVGQRT